MTVIEHEVHRAGIPDAGTVAALLDAFNREFDTPTPGVEVLTGRLTRLLADDRLVVLLSGSPATGIAVLSFRPNPWYDADIVTLDELYVRPDLRGQRIGHALLEASCALARERGAGTFEINVDGEDADARRFYEAHGFTNIEPGAPEPMYCYYKDLD